MQYKGSSYKYVDYMTMYIYAYFTRTVYLIK